MNTFVEGKYTYKISENKNFILRQPDATDIFIKISFLPIILRQNPILFEKYLTESKILRDDDAIIKSKTGKQIYNKYTFHIFIFIFISYKSDATGAFCFMSITYASDIASFTSYFIYETYYFV